MKIPSFIRESDIVSYVFSVSEHEYYIILAKVICLNNLINKF